MPERRLPVVLEGVAPRPEESRRAATRAEAEDAPSRAPSAMRPLSSGVVKAAAISILPWTVGSLLSPFGEPHPVLLVLPIATLVALIIVIRMRLRVRHVFIPWTLTSLLVATSAVRFLVLPFVSELTTAGDQMESSGESIQRVLLVLAIVKLTFYLVSAALFVSTGSILLTRKNRIGD